MFLLNEQIPNPNIWCATKYLSAFPAQNISGIYFPLPDVFRSNLFISRRASQMDQVLRNTNFALAVPGHALSI